MSTTFGIRIPTTGEVIEVAFRTHYVRWENPLAHLLPDETKVEPLDNTAQGIYTIGDIKKAIEGNGEYTYTQTLNQFKADNDLLPNTEVQVKINELEQKLNELRKLV